MAPRIVTSDVDLDAALVHKFLVGYMVDLTVEPPYTDPYVVSMQVTGTDVADDGALLIVGWAWHEGRDEPVEGERVTARYADVTEIEVF